MPAPRLSTRAAAAAAAFSAIPAPRGWPVVGTAPALLAAGSTTRLHRYVDRRHRRLGPVFREAVGPADCVFLADPGDMRAAFAQEGKHPVHLLPEPWVFYNNLYGCSRGLFFMNGEEWLHYRRIMNKFLLKGDLSWITACCDTVSQILTNQIEPDVEVTNLENKLYKLSLDMIVAVLLGPKTYDKARTEVDPQVRHLASTVHNVFKTSDKLSLIPARIAFKLKIPRWRRFEESVRDALLSGNELTELLSQGYPDGDGLLSKMRTEMGFSDMSRIVTDLILAAGDTTAYSIEWILYLLAKNRRVQDKIQELLKSEDSTQKHSYLRNVVRESLRLYPVAPFLTRIMTNDAVIRGYNIPKGTLVIMSIFTSGRDPRFFEDPEKFLPERWSKAESMKATHQASLPFAMGPRSCIGKKIAESLLESTTENLTKNYDIQLCNKKEVDVIMKMVAVPSEPIRLKFMKRL